MTLDDWAGRAEANRPWARRAVWTVLLLGLLGFVIRGADRPVDPVLAEAGAAGLTPPAGFEEIGFEIRAADGEVLDWCAILAATEAARRQGLMGQDDLLGYDGMAFRFDAPIAAAFYMYRTLIPLSVAFFDETGAFVSAADMEPCPAEEPGDCPTYPAAAPIVHALEVPKGGLGPLGVGPGSTMTLVEGDCR